MAKGAASFKPSIPNVSAGKGMKRTLKLSYPKSTRPLPSESPAIRKLNNNDSLRGAKGLSRTRMGKK